MKDGYLVKPTLASIPDKQLDMLHEAALKILADTGLNVHSAEVRSMLRKAGAQVKDDLRVYIPAELVNQSFATAPSRVDIYDRIGEVAMVLEGQRSYFGTGSDLKFTIDLETQQHRESTLRDVELSARLCDRLEGIDFVMSHALPNDVPPQQCEIEQMRVMLANTSKPLCMTLFSGRETFETMHEMACQSCGGESKFRKAPNYIMYGQFVSPLQHDAGAVERLMFCADHAVPVIYVPTIILGASGPVSLAGAIALSNAECLAGLVMHQLRAPGAPFIYGGNVSPLDMKTMVFSYGAPEWRLSEMAISQLSLRYNLPAFGTAGMTDTKVCDSQAGAEWAFTVLSSALSGSNLIHDVGYMDAGLTGSLESLVICDEIISMTRRFLAGFEVNEQTLALDMIDRVGPAGHFMEEDDTLDRFAKDVWYPTIFERDRFDRWQQFGSKDVRQRARDRVRQLLKR
jgi:trimethylamine--corrinoid protein Co-methyltransferase